jgi:GntR family transcriptional repressor for pyruvate dehydrogenase complex
VTAIDSNAVMPPRSDPSMEPRVARAETVARRVEAELSNGSIRPGERLGTKDDLRVRYGVAAGTLNEAIRLLSDRGLVEARPGPGGGLFAREPSASARLGHLGPSFREGGATAADSLVVRNALEPLIVADAVTHASPEAAETLRDIVGQMAAALEDPPAYLRANWELHRRIAAISPNTVLASSYLAVIGFAEEQASDDLPPTRQSLQVHRDLVEAIADGDQQKAARAVKRHEPLTADLHE